MNNQIELYDYETSDRLVFVHFLEEIEDTKKTFWNYLTEDPNPSLIFNRNLIWMILKVSRSQNNIVELYLLPKNKRANLFFYPDSPVLWFYIHKVDLYQKSGSIDFYSNYRSKLPFSLKNIFLVVFSALEPTVQQWHRRWSRRWRPTRWRWYYWH